MKRPTAQSSSAAIGAPERDVPTLAVDAYCRIEQMIVTGELRPGETVSEQGLARRLDTGRTPVREALQRLQANHMVAIAAWHGATVTEVSPQECHLLIEARWPLERLIGRLAARNASPEQRASIIECAAALVAAAAGADNAAVIACDRELKEVTARATRNRYLEEIVAPIHALSRRLYFAAAPVPVLAVATAYQRWYRAIAEPNEAALSGTLDQVMAELSPSRSAFATRRRP